MPDPITGITAVASIGGGLLSSGAQESAATTAAGATTASAEAGIAESRRQFDAIQELLAPFITAGTGAVGAQEALLGLGAPGTQEAAIAGFEQDPLFQAIARQGEEAILQQASATGGLRGGNVQGALAQFRPQLLNQQIQQQFGNLGSLSNLGQASAAGQASLGQQTGANIANLLGQSGAGQAGAALARGKAQSDLFGNIAGTIGTVAGAF